MTASTQLICGDRKSLTTVYAGEFHIDRTSQARALFLNAF
jgi:hypothetical protein